jgi:hypothetical protein
MARKLRIAASVFFAVVMLALCVLWVRSYQWNGFFYRVDNGNLTTIGLNKGQVYLTHSHGMAQSSFSRGWSYRAVEAALPPTTSKLRFSWNCPFWILTTLAAVGVTAPWIRTRFSLRTLLIATTLVAVVLGLGVWSAG